MMLPVLLFILQSPAPYRVGGGVTAPRILERFNPTYSQEARQARAQSTVIMSLIVDADGMPTDVRVVRPAGFGLDARAVESTKRWRFAPGEKEGQPVPVVAQIEVAFRLPDQPEFFSTLLFSLPEGAAPPELFDGRIPVVEGAGERHAKITLTVSDSGAVRDVRGEGLEQSVLAQISRWRFSPATRDGKAIAATGTLTIAWGTLRPKTR